jgi:hypothetical protein
VCIIGVVTVNPQNAKHGEKAMYKTGLKFTAAGERAFWAEIKREEKRIRNKVMQAVVKATEQKK